MARRLAGRMRRASIWLLAGVVAMVGGFTVQQAAVVDEAAARRDRARAAQELSTLVALWEGLVTDRIRSWTSDLAVSTERGPRELQLRSSVAWFDAYYLWTPGEQGALIWPATPTTDDPEALLDDPCLAEAHRLRVTGRALEAATSLDGCPSTTPAHGLFSSYLAARIRLAEKQPEAALATLEAASPPLRMSLPRAASRGFDVGRMLRRREQALTAYAMLDRDGAHLELRQDTIRDISDLDGPLLDAHLDTAVELLETLPADDARTAPLAERVQRAQRRLFAYRVLGERLVMESETARVGELHIVHDLYTRPGFLLVWTALPDGRRAAVQVDAQPLLQSFVDTLPTSTGLEVVDSRGIPVDENGLVIADQPPLDTEASVPLGRLFPQLHLSTAAHEGDPLAWTRLLLPLAPLAISFLLGVLAIMAQVTAERRERELQKRQQEFITRVTHELKTPLAGIRIMAETLQLGAAADPATRDNFLDRILNECNNLSERIDEVLSAARTPTLRNLTRLGAHALAAPVVERWRPRFVQRGATLEDRLDETPEVEVDIELMQDAIGNLLDNALKYGRPGIAGLCRIRTGVTRRWVIIEVSDNGLGVPPEKRELVFERFTRVEGPGRGKAGGHGLGLAFVADTASAHGGLVECVDGIDGGATFRIKLPRR